MKVVEDALSPGSIISGRFRLHRLLGRGGMASVWQAFHSSLNIDVAIKFLEPKWAGSEEVRSRFAQEATAIAKVRSPHVVHVLDYGFTEQGRLFIVMELLEGEDLGRRLARTQRLGLQDTVALVAQASRGLAKAHAANIIHRDIKPENLFIVSDEEGFWIKLLDFGVAKALGWGDAVHQTDTGQIVGTPLYMSPEQALGRVIDSRCDLYSLATVAYRCLTGRPPFVAKHLGELMLALNSATPPPASSFDSSLPRSIDDWFASMFAKDPDARCGQNARDVATSFEAACAGRGPGRAASLPVAESLAGAEAPTLPGEGERSPLEEQSGIVDALPSQAFSHSERHRIKSRRGRHLLASGLLIAVAGIGSVAIRAKREPAGPPAPASDERSLPGPPPPRSVQLRIAAVPTTAALYLDGQLLGANPFEGRASFDVGKHVLRVEAPGHVAAQADLTLDHDVQLELSLVPVPDGSLTSHAQRATDGPRPSQRTTRRATPTKPAVGDDASRQRRAPAAPAPRTPAEDKPLKRPLELDRSSPWQGP
jgi:serine/threonine-protein kinase